MSEEKARVFIIKHGKNGDGPFDIDRFVEAMLDVETSPDPTRYTAPDSIWKALETGSVQLVRASWLTALCNDGGVLPRRQDVPKDAVMPVAELRAMYGDGNRDDVLPIISISFCWETPEQPSLILPVAPKPWRGPNTLLVQ